MDSSDEIMEFMEKSSYPVLDSDSDEECLSKILLVFKELKTRAEKAEAILKIMTYKPMSLSDTLTDIAQTVKRSRECDCGKDKWNFSGHVTGCPAESK